MDGFEATKVVYSRIQRVDPENASKLMAVLLQQVHGEKEMIRLAFGPEQLLHSVLSNAHKHVRLPPPLAVPSPSWAASNDVGGVSSPTPFHARDLADELHFYPEECGSPGWRGRGGGGYEHRRSCPDLCVATDPGWRPCLYFARGYCKNGAACRFIHDTSAAAMAAADALVEQELLLLSNSPRTCAASPPFPYSPTSPRAVFLNDRAAGELMGRSRGELSPDYSLMLHPSSRQIYLTFPADSAFREEDVSDYFSIYGPVQDVRIPYQQKRMFGFVTFLYPETVKLILAKGNPHFVCDARVLVKPYKEKGRVPDKYRKQQLQEERGEFSGCPSPTGLETRDPYHLHQLGSRTLYSCQEALLQKQHAAAQLQHAIMELQLLDLKNRSLPSSPAALPPIPINLHSKFSASEGSGAAIKKMVNTPGGDDKEESEGSPSDDSDFQESLEHNLPDSPFASPTKASSTLLYPTPSFNSCFFQLPRLPSDLGGIGM